jgi:CBS domain-containing protein
MPPNSPRQRNPSLSQQAVQELINNPPVGRKDDALPRFAGRDWRSISLDEILVPDEVRFVEADSSVEAATKVGKRLSFCVRMLRDGRVYLTDSQLLIDSGAPNVILIRESTDSRKAIGVFDYDDLNSYLLLVTGLARPQDSDFDQVDSIVSRARTNQPVELGNVKQLLGRKEPPAFCEGSDTLARAVEIFGGGCHRILVRAPGSQDVVGILSQVRLLRFLWENRASFQPVEQLHNRSLKELDLGSHSVVSINGDRPLKDALLLMHSEGITSLPVLDNHKNVIGNISHVDVKLLTNTSALPLLDSSCIHFITVILSERGMQDGQDSFPVFHVNPTSTLAHTVAKLVATRSHRMWIVDAPSPAPSIPASPHLGPTATAPPPTHLSQLSSSSTAGLSASSNVTISAASLPGATLGGHLSGVVSLTDLLNLFARMSGLSPLDPDETRRRRRRSSSHSSMHASVDTFRSGIDGVGGANLPSARR